MRLKISICGIIILLLAIFGMYNILIGDFKSILNDTSTLFFNILFILGLLLTGVGLMYPSKEKTAIENINPNEMKTCSNCGDLVPSKDARCTHCGMRFKSLYEYLK